MAQPKESLLNLIHKSKTELNEFNCISILLQFILNSHDHVWTTEFDEKIVLGFYNTRNNIDLIVNGLDSLPKDSASFLKRLMYLLRKFLKPEIPEPYKKPVKLSEDVNLREQQIKEIELIRLFGRTFLPFTNTQHRPERYLFLFYFIENLNVIYDTIEE